MIRCEEKMVLSKDGKKIETTKDQAFREYLGWTIEKVKFILQINDRKICFEEEAERTKFISRLTQLDAKDSTSKEYCNKKGILLKVKLTNYVYADEVYDSNRDKVVAIKKDGLYGLVDFNGKEIVPLQYDRVFSFSEERAIVKKGEFHGVIDKTGKEIVPPKYDDIFNFREGKAIVKKGGLYGVIDKTGKEIIPCKYNNIQFVGKGEVVCNEKGRWSFVNKESQRWMTGKIITSLEEILDIPEQTTIISSHEIFVFSYHQNTVWFSSEEEREEFMHSISVDREEPYTRKRVV